MPEASFVFVTGNRDKLAEARRIVGPELAAAELELPEIQQLDLRAVLRAKAEVAWRALGVPLVVEDTGLELSALDGFPGPLVKWMLQSVGAEGIAKVSQALGDPRAAARCMLLYRDGDREVIAEGLCEGTLVLPARGRGGFGWDPVLVPDGETRSFGELTPAEKDRVGHRGKAWRNLLSQLAVLSGGARVTPDSVS